MSTCTGYCKSCRKAVTITMRVTAKYAVPGLMAIGGGIGIGTSRSRSRFAHGVLGALVGMVTGLLIDAATPSVQTWACGECGCDDVVIT